MYTPTIWCVWTLLTEIDYYKVFSPTSLILAIFSREIALLCILIFGDMVLSRNIILRVLSPFILPLKTYWVTGFVFILMAYYASWNRFLFSDVTLTVQICNFSQDSFIQNIYICFLCVLDCLLFSDASVLSWCRKSSGYFPTYYQNPSSTENHFPLLMWVIFLGVYFTLDEGGSCFFPSFLPISF